MDPKKTFPVSPLLGDAVPCRAVSPAQSGRLSLRRVSHSESESSSTACGSTCDRPTPSNSCVTRETSRGECARYRFIAWAAVKRNACERMTPSERLECPLLRCRRRFDDHEAMLRHLAGCDHLGTCEYWCYEHMRVERFDDTKCKACLGQPSKRRRMLCMAKNFFSSLGHKGRKNNLNGSVGGSPFGMADDEPLLFPLPPPSYDSISVPDGIGFELSGNAIAEIDSTEVAPKPPQPIHLAQAEAAQPAQTVPPAVVDPQVLILHELESGTLSLDDSFMQWQSPTAAGAGLTMSDPSTTWIDVGDLNVSTASNQRPPLQLNTIGLSFNRKIARPRPPRPAPPPARSKDLSPSSSVRSTTSTTSTTSTASDASNTSSASTMSNVSSLISPISMYSHSSAMGYGFAPHLTPPEDVLGSDFMCDDNLPAESSLPSSLYSSTICPPPEFLHSVFSELPADFPVSKAAPEDSAADALLFPYNSGMRPMQPDYAARIVINDEDEAQVSGQSAQHSVAHDDSHEEVATACQSGARVLAASAWDALLEHVDSSVEKMQHIRGNPLADQLRSMPPGAIAKSGLETLRQLLDGHLPTSPINTLCLVHVIYSLSLVVYFDDDLSARASQLYMESVLYGDLIPDRRVRVLYLQLATAIWHPISLSKAEMDEGQRRNYTSLQRMPSQKGKESHVDLDHHVSYLDDPLLCTARSFLDELEFSAIFSSPHESLEVLTSDLYTQHLQHDPQGASSSSFISTAGALIVRLANKFGNREDLLLALKELHSRVTSGSVSSVRKIELELLQVGKMHLSSHTYFDTYSSATSQLCDSLYRQYANVASQRKVYHQHDVSLLETMIAGLDKTVQVQKTLSAEGDALVMEDFINTLTPPSMEGYLDLGDVVMDFPELEGLEEAHKDTVAPSVQALSGDVGQSSSAASSPTTSTAPATTASSSSSPPTAPSSTTGIAKTEADACCEICGYRPKGDPRWFGGSMAKHRKLQHSTEPPKIFKCPFPGCASQYRSRPDNLRQHQIEKGHFVDGEEPSRRPSKRKKVSVE